MRVRAGDRFPATFVTSMFFVCVLMRNLHLSKQYYFYSRQLAAATDDRSLSATTIIVPIVQRVILYSNFNNDGNQYR